MAARLLSVLTGLSAGDRHLSLHAHPELKGLLDLPAIEIFSPLITPPGGGRIAFRRSTMPPQIFL